MPSVLLSGGAAISDGSSNACHGEFLGFQFHALTSDPINRHVNAALMRGTDVLSPRKGSIACQAAYGRQPVCVLCGRGGSSATGEEGAGEGRERG